MSDFKGDKYEEIRISGKKVFRKTKKWDEYQKECRFILAMKNASSELYDPKYSFNTFKGDQQIIKDIKKYVNNFNKNKFAGKSLYFYGKSFTQKSTLACSLAKELHNRNFSVYYVLFEQLLMYFKNKSLYDKNPEPILITKSKTVDFLIIDNCFNRLLLKDRNSFTETAKSALDFLLRERMEMAKKPTCLISQIPILEIEKAGYNRLIQNMLRRLAYQIEFEYTINDFDIDTLFDMED